ncbi:allograft inflammatory factor 1-like [Crassostrea virginica]
MSVNFNDRQGGKRYGELRKHQEEALDEVNRDFLDGDTYSDVEGLEERLIEYKGKFMEYDLDNSGDIDIMELKQMMEKLGQAKTHLELKKMIAEIDTDDSGTINYTEFLNMMLGKKNSILKIILMFEEKNKEKPRPTGLPPKKSLADLP